MSDHAKESQCHTLTLFCTYLPHYEPTGIIIVLTWPDIAEKLQLAAVKATIVSAVIPQRSSVCLQSCVPLRLSVVCVEEEQSQGSERGR